MRFFFLLFDILFSKVEKDNIFSWIGKKSLPIMTMQYWCFKIYNVLFEKNFGIRDIWHIENPLKAEYLIPTFIGELLSEEKMSVKVLRTNDTWYGMTYKEDVAAVKESFSKMLENGTYKGELFSDL